ncbi:heparin lyase I family protein [Phycisphaera mikurensis]|uniref:Polysaccharide lyase n=1 Tax=Phycisphaera mikurensis (strain NBRC 102666 / KCTC 22515 / FYK2301M01) TaxID=1142394 RepID=I0IDC9_PHYMF|nr:heparin lyase I family protein [Phycisphaera mikurensis]MBB6443346.1 hypothetical protein [Phycisphaera mikurensis]BAM03267.1 hypothetical protein PSMK_11080 [Phycisphaera mikurensis NBRC 102666]
MQLPRPWIVAAALALAGGVAAPPADAGRLFENTGENASVTTRDKPAWTGGLYKEDGNTHFINRIEGRGQRPSIRDSPRLSGQKSIRARVSRGGNDKKSRSEIYLVNPNQWYAGQTRYIGGAFYLPKWVDLHKDKWVIPLQVQQGPVGPIVAIELKPKTNDRNQFEWILSRRWGKGDKDGSDGYKNHRLGFLEKGKWHRFILKIKANHTGGGECRLYYKDGSRWKTISTYSGKLGNNWKNASNNDIDVHYGVYCKGGQHDDIEIFFDNMRFSTSFDGAKP